MHYGEVAERVAAVMRETMLARLATESPRSSSVEVDRHPRGGIPPVSNKYLLPVFWIRRGGVDRVVRAHRYALAVALGGRELPATEMGLHECDNTVCVKVVDPVSAAPGTVLHVVTGTQAQNMRRMGRLGRGGGRPAIPSRGEQLAARVRRARALREAVRDGWDGDAVAAALLGTPQELTLW